MFVIEILSQIINCIGTTVNMIWVNVKEKSKVLIHFIIGCTCVSISLGLLGAIVGMFVQLIFVVEAIINFFFEKKIGKYPWWLITIYVIIPCTLLIVTFKSGWDLLPIAAGILFPLALVSKDFGLRFLNLLSVFVWIPYNFHFGQYVGEIGCLIFTGMNTIAIIRLDVLKKNTEKN